MLHLTHLVQDTPNTANLVLPKRRCAGLVDKDRVGVMGGSHGGFLTGNLVGQYPSAFKCGVLRNPVMDLGLMIHVSDIPDWTYVEAFGSKVRSWLSGKKL